MGLLPRDLPLMRAQLNEAAGILQLKKAAPLLSSCGRGLFTIPFCENVQIVSRALALSFTIPFRRATTSWSLNVH